MKPKVILIGAGSGDPELITLKGYKALKKAKVVFYDALVNPKIVNYSKNALKIYVGKRNNNHSFTQEEINQMLVDYAFNYGEVVRLKGGDPFVFGRGNEEIRHIESFGIETEVISGISSCISVPASQGISVTERNITESFWVITATNSEGKIPKDIYTASKTDATIVILMGINKINQIIDIYKNANKLKTPIAIIHNGTLESSESYFGTIETIQEKVKDKKLKTPGIIVIGDVVKYSNRYVANTEFTYEDDFYYQNLNIIP
ncbi:MAG: uroporphyrinogen-III C-methyltransferase [Flavobacteriales bacterium]|nr:uroporphyrinogen-III C-methyltransferase [Flavobacteriales bacterium]